MKLKNSLLLYGAGFVVLIAMPYSLGFVFGPHHINWEGLFASTWVYTILFILFHKKL